MRSRGITRGADPGDHLSLAHFLTGFHQQLGTVGVKRADAVRMFQNDHIAVATVVLRADDLAGGDIESQISADALLGLDLGQPFLPAGGDIEKKLKLKDSDYAHI